MFAVCRCLLRLGFRVCSYDLVLHASYACMRKMRSCCVRGCWCQCLLRLRFRGCSHGLILLSSYACTRKKWFLDVFWVDGVDVCFVYSLGFVHMDWSCFLVMPVREKNGLSMCSGLMVSMFASFTVRVCSHGLILLSGYACMRKKLFLDVFWVDGVDLWFVYGHGFVHVVYVPKLHTANHLGELS